jgi:acetyltransferase-like isoleucine patch superfamily enzyme
MILKEFLRRIYYYKSFSKFKKYGKNMRFGKGGVFLRPDEIEFGDNVFIGRNFHISARNLTFGSNIMIGPNLVIECDNHTFNKVGDIMFEVRKERQIGKTIIENDVWIGANVIILPDVKISEGSVIGAGSVVTKSIAPYTVAVGNPAKPIKRRFDTESLKRHLENVDSIYSSSDIISIWENETGK